MFKKILNSQNNRLLKDYEKVADAIMALETKYKVMSDEELKAQTPYFKELLENGKTLDEIVVPAYAVIREAARRAHDMLMYKVQLIGSLVIHNGELAEMRTGEGKTLTMAAPLYLNALTGKGVHSITVNEYLVERDAKFMEEIMNYVGVSVGFNTSNMDNNLKRDMYAKDITYTTNSELGFDYLRDNMVKNLSQKVQRGLNFCIIDEADSVLIDEARTPLIISGGEAAPVQTYLQVDALVKTLKNEKHFEIDWENLTISLTSEGVTQVEKMSGLKNLYNIQNSDLFHRIQNSLRAVFIFKKGKEYLVDNGEIKLIDHSTGRVMDGRSYSNGLHQAIQAKEGVKVEPETLTVASITYQSFFRLYSKLSGTSGTLKSSEDEFLKIYNLRTLVVPTNKPVIRKDHGDILFGHKHHKYDAIVKRIKDIHEKGQPLLIGTASVQASEEISERLKKEKIQHELLNAKNHAREAEIVAKAGEFKSITIATNMAGRGTDIKPDAASIKVGGLYVIGTEKHETQRIDNQLRGRSGRQGQPGESQFYVCAEDELLNRFSNVEHIKNAFGTPKGSTGSKTMGRIARRLVNQSQSTIEGKNFDSRKHLLEFDNIGSQQREIIYRQRNDVLNPDVDIKYILKRMHLKIARDLWELNQTEDEQSSDWDQIHKKTIGKLIDPNTENLYTFSKLDKEEAVLGLSELFYEHFLNKHKDVPEENINAMVRDIVINIMDENWKRHLTGLEKLVESINLRSSESQNPISIYVKEADSLFEKMLQMIAHRVGITVYTVQFQRQPTPEEIEEFKRKLMNQMNQHQAGVEDKSVDGSQHAEMHSRKDVEDELSKVTTDALKANEE